MRKEEARAKYGSLGCLPDIVGATEPAYDTLSSIDPLLCERAGEILDCINENLMPTPRGDVVHYRARFRVRFALVDIVTVVTWFQFYVGKWGGLTQQTCDGCGYLMSGLSPNCRTGYERRYVGFRLQQEAMRRRLGMTPTILTGLDASGGAQSPLIYVHWEHIVAKVITERKFSSALVTEGVSRALTRMAGRPAYWTSGRQ